MGVTTGSWVTFSFDIDVLPPYRILAQNPTTRHIGLSNRKMASVFHQVKISLSSAGLVQLQWNTPMYEYEYSDQ